MGFWSQAVANVRKLLLLQDQLDRLSSHTKELAERVDDHTYRLVRIETIIELARK